MFTIVTTLFIPGEKVIFDLNNVSGSTMRVATGIDKFELYKAKLTLCGKANVFNLEQHEKTLSPFYREVRLALGLKPKELVPGPGQGAPMQVGGPGSGLGGTSTETVPETNYTSSKDTGGNSANGSAPAQGGDQQR